MNSLLIKGGTVIDGTGAPRFQGDVLVAEGKIKAVGESLGEAVQVIDASGLVVTPGIVDPHTHLDAQLLWEPRGTSSSWHGVTTVATGMCGYSLAPVHPEHRDYILRMFCRVEEMPLEMLQGGVPWTWTTMPQYMDSLDTGLGMNVAPMVGHSALRYYVMGPEAGRREATQEEIQSMCGILRESIEAGAFGLTTSRNPAHRDWDWNPVPSRQARPEELIALAGELRGTGATSLALISSGTLSGMTDEDHELVLGMARASQKPVQLNAIGPSDWDFMETHAAQGMRFWAVTNSQSRYRIWTLREGTVSLHTMQSWRDVMEKPVEERLRLLASPELRQTLRDEVDSLKPRLSRSGRTFRMPWDALWVSRAAREENRALEGLSLHELARRQGKHVADALLDLAASEDFDTEFRNQIEPGDEIIDEAKAARVRSPHSVPMNTDAGAHVGNECRTGEPTYFLRHWVLDKPFMSLEEGVRKLTSLPAEYVGLTDRGVIREGMAADIMVLDPSEIGTGLKERAWDMPDGSKRWVQKATGVHYVIVNGQPTIWEGEEVGALPGKVLRSGDYR